MFFVDFLHQYLMYNLVIKVFVVIFIEFIHDRHFFS